MTSFSSSASSWIRSPPRFACAASSFEIFSFRSAGRTIWLNAVRTHFPDLKAVSEALHREGVGVLDSLSKLTKTKAKSWSAQYPVFDHIKKEGDFARAY